VEDIEERPGRSRVRYLSASCLFDLLTYRRIPSYGHGVLRKSDPRFMALQAFCDTRPELVASPIIQLVKKACKGCPPIPPTLLMKLIRPSKSLLECYLSMARYVELTDVDNGYFTVDAAPRRRILTRMSTLRLVCGTPQR
jgi:hypothetical protein